MVNDTSNACCRGDCNGLSLHVVDAKKIVAVLGTPLLVLSGHVLSLLHARAIVTLVETGVLLQSHHTCGSLLQLRLIGLRLLRYRVSISSTTLHGRSDKRTTTTNGLLRRCNHTVDICFRLSVGTANLGGRQGGTFVVSLLAQLLKTFSILRGLLQIA